MKMRRKMQKLKGFSLAIVGLFFALNSGFGQEDKLIDGIVAQVGNEEILFSDIEAQVLQLRQAGQLITDTTRCLILEELLMQSFIVTSSGAG